MRRILVTGGAGFLGSHLCARSDRRRPSRHRARQLLHGTPGERQASPRGTSAQLRARPPRRRRAALRRGRRDLSPRVSRVAGALPARSVRTLKTSVLGTMNVLELARDAARGSCHVDERDLRRPGGAPATRSYWGHVESDRHRAPVTTRASAAARRCSSPRAAARRRRHASCASSTPTARACRGRRPRGLELHRQALRGEPLTIYGDGTQTRSLCYVTTSIDGLIAMMASRRIRVRSTSAIPREMTVHEIADSCSSSPVRSTIELRRAADDPTRRRPDISKAKAEPH